MKKFTAALLLIILILTALSACTNNQQKQDPLIISAAASLRDPLEEIIKAYTVQESVEINVNYGSSGTLQKQIEEGAPVDVFISAGNKQVEALLEKRIADKSSYKELLTNSLVLIVSNSYDKGIKSIEDLTDKDIRLAIGETSTVPAGQYSKEFLDNAQLWNSFEDKLVFAKDVKAVLSYVEAGDAQAGIVYYSDAVNLKNSYIAYSIPIELHKPIVYPAAAIAQSRKLDTAKHFIDFLGNQECKAIFEKYNFKAKD